jgi:hypothetical protein
MNSNSNPATDSEEENKRELEKIKHDILRLMVQRDEPVTIMQVSYGTKYAKKYSEEAMDSLLAEGRIKRKELAKNNIVYYLVNTNQVQLRGARAKLDDMIKIEQREIRLDSEVALLQKEIAELKLHPTTAGIRTETEEIK